MRRGVNIASSGVRATVDNNVWISGLLSDRGAPARLIEAFRAARFTLVSSDPLLEELAGVLQRPRLLSRSGVTPERVASLLHLIREQAEIVDIPGAVHVCRDPDDDAVIETAIQGRVDVLVTGDGDILGDPNVMQFLSQREVDVWTIPQFTTWLEEGAGRGN